MQRKGIETAVGIFVLIGILCVAYLAVRLGRMEMFGGDYYTISAYFTTVTGLKTGAPVELAGVEVGRVDSIGLDSATQMAVVQLKIQNGLEIKDDAIASIKTSGLIGDKFIRLTAGGSPQALKPGDSIMDTEAPLDIEELIGKFVFGKV
ncbi:MAG: outer membrane lipid asymmetry maintenance protein MlaD [Desulfatitalea sp.]|nr:outer membrane lipid asymmetry maintenance protein MlaD [Desulfatitalea sp.]